jgi:hypothetical protein
MEEHIKLRLEYKKLVRDGKKEAAQKILKKIWDKKSSSAKTSPEKKVEQKPVVVKAKKKINRISNLNELTSINGLGRKSLDDIKKQFDNIEELKEALINDKVALRDDVVEKLKEVLI